MSKLTLTQKLRTGHLVRWHMVRVARQQTVAEHMYRVYLITQSLCQALGVDDPNELMLAESWALWHDLPEVVLGDIPTPTKELMGDLRHEEMNMDDDFRDLARAVTGDCPVVEYIVKLADLAESIEFLRIEGMGPRAGEIQHNLRASHGTVWFEARKRWPEYNWATAQNLMDEIL